LARTNLPAPRDLRDHRTRHHCLRHDLHFLLVRPTPPSARTSQNLNTPKNTLSFIVKVGHNDGAKPFLLLQTENHIPYQMGRMATEHRLRLFGEIDDKINNFLNGPLEDEWPYVWLGATCLNVREAGRIISVAVTIETGVNADGRREVLGLAISASEAETFWTEFLRSLARRGSRGVKFIISDAHSGLKTAIAKVLHATW
jgi:hypothetical protein